MALGLEISDSEFQADLVRTSLESLDIFTVPTYFEIIE